MAGPHAARGGLTGAVGGVCPGIGHGAETAAVSPARAGSSATARISSWVADQPSSIPLITSSLEPTGNCSGVVRQRVGNPPGRCRVKWVWGWSCHMEDRKMQRQMRVINGTAAARRRSGVESVYDHFRLERQGELASPRALEHYDYMFGEFLRWLEAERPDVRRVEDLDVSAVRAYRAALAVTKKRDGKRGRQQQDLMRIVGRKVLATDARSSTTGGASGAGSNGNSVSLTAGTIPQVRTGRRPGHHTALPFLTRAPPSRLVTEVPHVGNGRLALALTSDLAAGSH